MLLRFEVENFKGFKDRIVLDLTAHDYEFNPNIICSNIVNKALVYGENGSGKSSLGIALFDIVSHLTDKERMSVSYTRNYINLDSTSNVASFKYIFKFDDDLIEYEYQKADFDELVYEKLVFNENCVVEYDYSDESNTKFVASDMLGELNIVLNDNKLSVLKYIYRNTPTNTSPLLTKMMHFCENMLWYRSLSDGNAYCGFTNGSSKLADMLYDDGDISKFEDFLRENGLEYHLEFVTDNGKNELYADFKNGRAPFSSIASTGTKALFLYYTWSLSFNRISLLFIDEFDAFLHFESSANIVKQLNQASNFQTILTTHNVFLLKNELTRPDCCYILSNNKLICLADLTDKEIREAHNLEKMYVNGAFHGK